jgi:hypothetical protein
MYSNVFKLKYHSKILYICRSRFTNFCSKTVSVKSLSYSMKFVLCYIG